MHCDLRPPEPNQPFPAVITTPMPSLTSLNLLPYYSVFDAESAAELLQFQCLTLWPWTCCKCCAWFWDNFHQVWPSTTYTCLNYSVFYAGTLRQAVTLTFDLLTLKVRGKSSITWSVGTKFEPNRAIPGCIIRLPHISRKGLKFYQWTFFLFYESTVLSSHAEDGHQMYFGGSLVGKVSTILRPKCTFTAEAYISKVWRHGSLVSARTMTVQLPSCCVDCCAFRWQYVIVLSMFHLY